MALVSQSIVLLELTQCSNSTAKGGKGERKMKQQVLKAKNQSRLAPWRLVSASYCMAYCFWKRMQCQGRRAGDTETAHVHTHQKQSICQQIWLKAVWNLPKQREERAFAWLCDLSCSQVPRAGHFLVPVPVFLLLYSSISLLGSWLSNSPLFSRHLSTCLCAT